MKTITSIEMGPDEIANLFRSIVKEELKEAMKNEQQQKLLSPAETCKLFDPAISLPTLRAWTKQGLLNKKRIGGRVFYMQSEVLESAKTLKRYKKNDAA